MRQEHTNRNGLTTVVLKNEFGAAGLYNTFNDYMFAVNIGDDCRAGSGWDGRLENIEFEEETGQAILTVFRYSDSVKYMFGLTDVWSNQLRPNL